MALGRYFRANCLSSDAVGVFVYISGPAVGSIPQVTQVDITVSGKFPAAGIIVEKSDPTTCLVQVRGEVEVSPAALVPGKPYFVGLDGVITNLPPAPLPGVTAAIQSIGIAIDTGRLHLNVHPNLYLHKG